MYLLRTVINNFFKSDNTPPVLVLNNFSQSTEQQVKLMKITFQNMFPTINVKTVKLGDCRRVVLFHYNKEDDIVELRHYAIRANPVGISRTVRRVIQAKIPDLSNLEDISEFLEGSNSFSGSVSDSEVEDESSRVSFYNLYEIKNINNNQAIYIGHPS